MLLPTWIHVCPKYRQFGAQTFCSFVIESYPARAVARVVEFNMLGHGGTIRLVALHRAKICERESCRLLTPLRVSMPCIPRIRGGFPLDSLNLGAMLLGAQRQMLEAPMYHTCCVATPRVFFWLECQGLELSARDSQR